MLASSSQTRTFTPDYSGAFQDALYRLGLVVMGLVVLALIIAVKSKTASELWTSPFLFAYTLFITTFELSRVLGAMLYERSMRQVERRAALAPLAPYEPTISFVIPCKNEEQSIEKTIVKSFSAQYPREKLEVIVINDGSTDGTLKVLRSLQKRYPQLIVVNWRKNKGKRHGMAAGFRLAKGEIIIQLDSDSYIEPSTIRALVEPFCNPEIGAVCAHADPENADQNFLTKMQAAYYFMSFRILKAAESTFMSVFCCSGCSSAYRRSVVLPILGTWLDEMFLGRPVTWGDDRALTNWVIRLGYKTIYTDRAQAYTICPDNLRQLMKQQVRWKKGWFVNSVFASTFIWKKQPFVAFTYFYPLIAITLSTPVMATKALVYNPFIAGITPFYYFLGIFLIACIITIYYRYVARQNKYWPYIFAWSTLNMFILSFILFYALATIQNRKWGTR